MGPAWGQGKVMVLFRDGLYDLGEFVKKEGEYDIEE